MEIRRKAWKRISTEILSNIIIKNKQNDFLFSAIISNNIQQKRGLGIIVMYYIESIILVIYVDQRSHEPCQGP